MLATSPKLETFTWQVIPAEGALDTVPQSDGCHYIKVYIASPLFWAVRRVGVGVYKVQIATLFGAGHEGYNVTAKAAAVFAQHTKHPGEFVKLAGFLGWDDLATEFEHIVSAGRVNGEWPAEDANRGAGSSTDATKEMAPGHSGATVVDGEFLLQLCSRMNHALSQRDERNAYCFMESARAMACAVLGPEHIPVIHRAVVAIEADMDNGLWESAIRSGRYFTKAISQGIQKTNKQN
jgi:hypothetical protein